MVESLTTWPDIEWPNPLQHGLDIEWLNPLQHGIPKMCKNLVDETIVPRKEGWLVVKMKGRYI
jgi:hypothetical protein